MVYSQYALLLAPFFLYTLQGVYLKWLSLRKISKLDVSLVYVLTVFALSLMIFHGSLQFRTTTLIYALLDGISYGLSVWVTLKLLEKVGASIVYPFRRLSNPIVSVLFVLTLGEVLKLTQALAVMLATLAVFVFTSLKLPKGEKKLLVLLLLLLLTSGYF